MRRPRWTCGCVCVVGVLRLPGGTLRGDSPDGGLPAVSQVPEGGGSCLLLVLNVPPPHAHSNLKHDRRDATRRHTFFIGKGTAGCVLRKHGFLMVMIIPAHQFKDRHAVATPRHHNT